LVEDVKGRGKGETQNGEREWDGCGGPQVTETAVKLANM